MDDSDTYSLALADSLRQLAEAQWTLDGEPMPEDARQALNNAAGLLALHHHQLQTGLTTIRVQGDFIKAMGRNMREAGCDFDPESCCVVNTLAARLRSMMDHSCGGDRFVVYGTAQSIAEIELRLAPMLAARPEVP